MQVCGSKQYDSHAGCQEVSRCCIRGESEESIACRRRSTQATLALKPRTDVTRSTKQGYRSISGQHNFFYKLGKASSCTIR